MTVQQMIGAPKDRAPFDFYATPAWATKGLLKQEDGILRLAYGTEMWEPASGDGAISKVLEEAGYNVYSSDIRTDDSVYGDKGVDFLKTNRQCDIVFTNPPFTLATEFIEHGLECAKAVVILGRIQLLEGTRRYKRIWEKDNLARVYVFRKRLSCLKNGVPVTGSTLCFAWFIFDHDYHIPELGWV